MLLMATRIRRSTIHEYAQLTVTENRLHNNGECSYCDQIRQWQEQGRVIAIYDVSLSYDFRGTATLTFPVSSEYNEKTLTVVHCLKERLDTYDMTVSDRKLTITVDAFSPFAILDSSNGGPGQNDPATGTENPGTDTASPSTDGVKSPKTGDKGGISPWEAARLCVLSAMPIVGAVAIIYKRRRKTGTQE